LFLAAADTLFGVGVFVVFIVFVGMALSFWFGL